VNCKPASAGAVNASRFFTILSDSISQSTLVQYYQLKWQGWDKLTSCFAFPPRIPVILWAYQALKYFRKL
jgi:hypothetical protein